MNKKITLLAVAVLFCFSFVFAQDTEVITQTTEVKNHETKSIYNSGSESIPFWKGWAIGLNLGITQFDGDIRQWDHIPAYQETGDFFELRSAASLSLHKQFNSYFALNAEFLAGSFAGLRRETNTEDDVYFSNLFDPYGNYEGGGEKFEASFKEADLLLNIDLSNVFSYVFKTKKEGKLSYGARLGLGYNVFNTVRRNTLSDSYIYSYGYSDEGAIYSGNDYGNDKKGFFNSPAETVFIYGVQAKYKLNKKLHLLLDYTVRNGHTDKWDASVMNTVNPIDKINFLSLGLVYRIGKQDYAKDWEKSVDAYCSLNSNVHVKIDTSYTGFEIEIEAEDEFIYFPSIYFNTASDIVGGLNKNQIEAVAHTLKNNPNINLNVIGHTDYVGKPEFNKILGTTLIKAVIYHLVFNYKISPDRLSSITRGEEEQLSNVKEINRRVDFEIID